MLDQQDKNTRKLAILGVIIAALIIIGTIWAAIVRQQQSNNTATDQTRNVDEKIPSPEQTASVIAEATGLLNESGQPGLRVERVTGPAIDWYIATVRNEQVSTDEAQVILKRTGDKLELVLGPGTAFPESALVEKQVPVAVKQQLNVVAEGEI